MRTATLAATVLLVSAGVGFAQFGEELLGIAEKDEISVVEALWLTGSASGSIRPEVEVAGARRALGALDLRLPRSSDEEPVTLGELAYVLMQLFDLRSGLWYGLVPAPMTALKALQSAGIADPDAHAGEHVSGATAVAILKEVLETAARELAERQGE